MKHEHEMIIAVLTVSLTLLLGTVCSVFAQSDDIGSVLDKAQKSLDTQQSKNTKPPSIATKSIDYSNYKKYENLTHGVKIKYPKDWIYQGSPNDESSPDTVFNVNFFSPVVGGGVVLVGLSIEKLSPGTSLEGYKDRILKNMKENNDTKDIIVSKNTLNGQPAYKIEDMSFFIDHWEKGISIYSVKNGKLYQVDVLAEPELIQKHSEHIKNMIQSVEFGEPVPIKVSSTDKVSDKSTVKTKSTHNVVKKSTKQSNCDSSYPDFCIPPPPPNLNCPDIPQKRFTVAGSDPHGFDRDNDGIGCES